MKYNEIGFRNIYHRYYAITLTENLRNVIKEFPGAKEANCVLVYGYIDHQCGVTLEVLATGRKEGELFSFAEGNDKVRGMIRIGATEECDFYPLDEAIGKEHSDKVATLKAYDKTEEIEKTRAMEFLDECRDANCVDDVLVHLIKNGLQTEGCWVRIEGIQEPGLKGTLLNEPYQDFGCHIQDIIPFRITQLEDGSFVCFADRN